MKSSSAEYTTYIFILNLKTEVIRLEIKAGTDNILSIKNQLYMQKTWVRKK